MQPESGNGPESIHTTVSALADTGFFDDLPDAQADRRRWAEEAVEAGLADEAVDARIEARRDGARLDGAHLAAVEGTEVDCHLDEPPEAEECEQFYIPNGGWERRRKRKD